MPVLIFPQDLLRNSPSRQTQQRHKKPSINIVYGIMTFLTSVVSLQLFLHQFSWRWQMAEAVVCSGVGGKRCVCAACCEWSGCCTRAVLLLSDSADHLRLLLMGVLCLHMDPWDFTSVVGKKLDEFLFLVQVDQIKRKQSLMPVK